MARKFAVDVFRLIRRATFVISENGMSCRHERERVIAVFKRSRIQDGLHYRPWLPFRLCCPVKGLSL